jgi:hypothetical protein
MDKVKEEAIQDLKKGADFEDKKFDLFRDDRNVSLEAVKQNGQNLKLTSDRLKNDKEIVFEAVIENGYALEHASDKLKDDKAFIVEAVKQSGTALRFVSDKLKNDNEVVLEALKENGNSLEWASQGIKKSVENGNPYHILEEAVHKEQFNSMFQKTMQAQTAKKTTEKSNDIKM